MRLKTLAVATAAAVAVLALPGTAEANHSWGGYHWARTANPFTLRLGDNVTSTWDSYLVTTSSDWSQSTVLDTTIVAGNGGKGRCKAVTGMVQVCNATYGNNGWLGVASISITGGSHITAGSVKVNDTYFNTATYNTPAWRNLVMCQEVGHDFGLAHQDENFDNANLDTCMDYTSSPASNQHPNTHDYQLLTSLYTHLDSINTSGSQLSANAPPAMGQIDFASPGQWGRLVGQSQNGRKAVYELDFGNGNKVITDVFWADPEHDHEH